MKILNAKNSAMLLKVILTLFYFAIGINCISQKLILPVKHLDKIESAIFSPDNKLILTNSIDGTAKVWETKTGLLLSNLEIDEKLCEVKFSLDGDAIIGRTLTKIICWSTQNCEQKLTINTDSLKIITGFEILEQIPNRNDLLVNANDSTLQIININSGKTKLNLKTNSWIIYAKFNEKGDEILFRTFDSCFIWNIETNTIVFSNKLTSRYAPICNNDLSLLTIQNDSGVVTTFDTRKNSRIFATNTSLNYGKFYCYNHSGDKIAILYKDGNIKIWEAKKGKYISTLNRQGTSVEEFAFNSNGSRLLTTVCEGDPVIWDVKTGKIIAQFNRTGETKYGTKDYKAIKYDKREEKIVAVNLLGNISIWDAETGTLLNEMNQGRDYYECKINFSSDGKNALLFSNWIVTILNIPKNRVSFDLKGSVVRINSILSDKEKGIIITSNKQGFTIWDSKFIKPPIDVRGFLQPVSKPAIFGEVNTTPSIILLRLIPDKNILLFATEDGEVYYIDLKKETGTRTTLGNLKHAFHWITSAYISANCEKMGVFVYDTLRIWDLKKEALIDKFVYNEPSHFDTLLNSKDLNDLKMLIDKYYKKSGSTDTSRIPDILHYKIPNFSNSASFSEDGKRCVVASGSRIFIYDLINGHYKLIDSSKFEISWNGLTTIDGQYVVLKNDKQMSLCNIDSLKSCLNFAYSGNINFSNSLPQLSKDKKHFFTLSENNLKIWDVKNGALISILNNSDVYKEFCLVDSNIVMMVSTMGVCHVWNYKKKSHLYDFASFGQTNDFISIPSGEFKASPGASKLLHYVTKNLKVITFEQLDVRYNRPDKVLQALGNSDTLLIHSFRRAYEKRIKRLRIDTTAFGNDYAIPEADFFNRGDTAKDGIQILHIKAFDSIYTLDRFNVWVNEVPLYGQRGISLRSRKTFLLDTIIHVSLSEGENRIETSVLDVNGTESFRSPFTTDYYPKIPIKAVTYFVGIGVDSFADNSKNLKYSVKDIKDLAAKFKIKYKENIEFDTLFNINVTVENIRLIKQKLQHSRIDDRVIVAYSGHGLLTDSLDYYLSTSTVNFKKPEINGLPYEELENLVDSIPARKKLVLIDACHSGEFDRTDFISTIGNNENLIKQNDKGKTKPRSLSLENIFELMQSLFVNVSKGTGATIMSAVSGVDLAKEEDSLKNGIFISTILDALDEHPSMSLSQLKKLIVEGVQNKSRGKQKPSFRNDPINIEWMIW